MEDCRKNNEDDRDDKSNILKNRTYYIITILDKWRFYMSDFCYDNKEDQTQNKPCNPLENNCNCYYLIPGSTGP